MLKKCEQVTNVKGVLSYVHESNVAVKSLLVFQILVLNPLLYSKRSKNNINRLKKCEQEYYHMYMNQICSKVTIESPLLLLGKSPNPDGSIITPWSQHMNISRVPTHTDHSSWMSTQHTTRSQPFCYVPYVYLQTTQTHHHKCFLESQERPMFLESQERPMFLESQERS